LHRTHQVALTEAYPVIYNIWKWLIECARAEDILAYTDFYEGQDIRDLGLPPAHKDLIGFCINLGSSSPKNIVQKWSCHVKKRPGWASITSYQLKRIARLLPEIKHWTIPCKDYRDLPDLRATWFIDPPYQYGGAHYMVNNIDYIELADWCKSRKGQVIVCENTKAYWLPFQPLCKTSGQRRETTEAVWYNN
jgi:hypothetical protein